MESLHYSDYQYVLNNWWCHHLTVSDATECTSCPPGHYCPAGTEAKPRTSPEPCVAGTYNPDFGAGHSLNCRKCDAGYSCPLVGQSSVNETCAEGKYIEFFDYYKKALKKKIMLLSFLLVYVFTINLLPFWFVQSQTRDESSVQVLFACFLINGFTDECIIDILTRSLWMYFL